MYSIASNEWTWIFGIDHLGFYGTKGVASINNYPGGRYGQYMHLHASLNRLYILAGTGYIRESYGDKFVMVLLELMFIGYLNDLWLYAVPNSATSTYVVPNSATSTNAVPNSATSTTGSYWSTTRIPTVVASTTYTISTASPSNITSLSSFLVFLGSSSGIFTTSASTSTKRISQLSSTTSSTPSSALSFSHILFTTSNEAATWSSTPTLSSTPMFIASPSSIQLTLTSVLVTPTISNEANEENLVQITDTETAISTSVSDVELIPSSSLTIVDYVTVTNFVSGSSPTSSTAGSSSRPNLIGSLRSYTNRNAYLVSAAAVSCITVFFAVVFHVAVKRIMKTSGRRTV